MGYAHTSTSAKRKKAAAKDDRKRFYRLLSERAAWFLNKHVTMWKKEAEEPLIGFKWRGILQLRTGNKTLSCTQTSHHFIAETAPAKADPTKGAHKLHLWPATLTEQTRTKNCHHS
jgi:hypothetical protein